MCKPLLALCSFNNVLHYQFLYIFSYYSLIFIFIYFAIRLLVLGLRCWRLSITVRGSEHSGFNDSTRINGCRITSAKSTRNRRWMQLLLLQFIHLRSYQSFPHGAFIIKYVVQQFIYTTGTKHVVC